VGPPVLPSEHGFDITPSTGPQRSFEHSATGVVGSAAAEPLPAGGAGSRVGGGGEWHAIANTSTR